MFPFTTLELLTARYLSFPFVRGICFEQAHECVGVAILRLFPVPPLCVCRLLAGEVHSWYGEETGWVVFGSST
jgi:hypothetical protein